jgi:hypothetical protein
VPLFNGGFNKTSSILGNQMELKKVKGKTYGKGRDKRNVKSENVNFKKKQDTIEDPHNKHTVENQCC